MAVQVQEVKDLQGNVYAWKCPQCGSIQSEPTIADECLRSHAQALNETTTPPANLTEG